MRARMTVEPATEPTAQRFLQPIQDVRVFGFDLGDDLFRLSENHRGDDLHEIGGKTGGGGRHDHQAEREEIATRVKAEVFTQHPPDEGTADGIGEGVVAGFGHGWVPQSAVAGRPAILAGNFRSAIQRTAGFRVGGLLEKSRH